MTNLRTLGLFTLARTFEKGIVGTLSAAKPACLALLFCAATAIGSVAQTFTTLANFDPTNGGNPQYGPLVQGFDGNLYGAAYRGGANSAGTVFRITLQGELTTLYSFCSLLNCVDGGYPVGGLLLASDGNFYGTTTGGGMQGACFGGCGTVFEITPAGTLTTLHSFDGIDGSSPQAELLQAADGDFYGATTQGGTYSHGSVFKITSNSKFTSLYSFCSHANCSDGATPVAGLIQAPNGNFYGTTYLGGAFNYGSVFEMTEAGQVTTLASFDFNNGYYPFSKLVQGDDRYLYGTTEWGGTLDYGTVFEISAAGTLTILHNFDYRHGKNPVGGLIQATNDNFYGTAEGGGNNVCSDGCGTVFEMTARRDLTTLHYFDSTDGGGPLAGLVQATNGNLYGTTSAWGGNSSCFNNFGCGTVFSLSTGLGPFIETLPGSGKTGANIVILGNNLTGTTGVMFNETPATFKIVSDTEITTTVPTGATTGTVEVTMPSGTLTSNKNFRIIP